MDVDDPPPPPLPPKHHGLSRQTVDGAITVSARCSALRGDPRHIANRPTGAERPCGRNGGCKGRVSGQVVRRILGATAFSATFLVDEDFGREQFKSGSGVSSSESLMETVHDLCSGGGLR